MAGTAMVRHGLIRINGAQTSKENHPKVDISKQLFFPSLHNIFNHMGPLKNSRHEAFVFNVFQGMPIGVAYTAAGGTAKGASAQAAGSRLLAKPKCAARLEELKNTKIERAMVTKQWLQDRVQDLAQKAEEKEQLAVAKGCYELLGRDHGAFQERKTITVRRLGDLSIEELEEITASREHTPAPSGKGKTSRKD